MNFIIRQFNFFRMHIFKARDGFFMFLLGDIKFSDETIDTFIFILKRRLKSSDFDSLPDYNPDQQKKNSGTNCDDSAHNDRIH